MSKDFSKKKKKTDGARSSERHNEKKREEGLCDNEEPKDEVLNVYLKINCASCILSFQ